MPEEGKVLALLASVGGLISAIVFWIGMQLGFVPGQLPALITAAVIGGLGALVAALLAAVFFSSRPRTTRVFLFWLVTILLAGVLGGIAQGAIVALNYGKEFPLTLPYLLVFVGSAEVISVVIGLVLWVKKT